MGEISSLTILWLFGLAFVAGCIDAMAGGGGLLTLPGLLATGLDPVAASATNKSQAIFSSLSAAFHFWRKGKLRLRDHALPGLAACGGSALGAALLSIINPNFLKLAVPFLLIGIALWVLFTPRLGEITRVARLSFVTFSLTLVPLISFYDGFFGPAAGTFFALSSVVTLGLKLDEATMRAKVYNSMSNLGALGFFLATGHVVWLYSASMIVGTIIGSTLGARLILKHGTSLIKPMLVIMSIAMSLKLFSQQAIIQGFFHSH